MIGTILTIALGIALVLITLLAINYFADYETFTESFTQALL